MAATILALPAVLVVGVDCGGAKGWLGVGDFTIQPAEFAKMTVIIYLPGWLAGRGDSLRSFEGGLIPFVVIIGSIGVLIILQPNLGTTLIILLITVTMFWVAGASVLQMLTLFVTGFATMAGYRAGRLSSFFSAESDPLGNGFQTLKSLIALGNGGITGLGLGASRSKFFCIPDSHTDGVFAILGEEMGVVATSAVLLLYVVLMVRGYQIARRSRDEFGMLLATGITTWIAVQALLNIGGIIRIIPLTGVPLPFLSYGGSALAAEILAVGIVVSVSHYGEDRGGFMYRERPRVPRGQIIRRRRL